MSALKQRLNHILRDYHGVYLVVYRNVLKEVLPKFLLKSRMELEILSLVKYFQKEGSCVTTGRLKKYYNTVSDNQFYATLRKLIDLRFLEYCGHKRGGMFGENRYRITDQGNRVLWSFNFQMNQAIIELEDELGGYYKYKRWNPD